jgi:PAS domain S-box-containing protein/putative nucleotidyltransferase with HDIG domain
MLRFVNQAASEITGYSKQELRAVPFLEFIHPDDRQMVGERYLKRLKGDVSQPRYVFRLIKKGGSIKWVEIDAVLVAWEGKPATLNFLNDITERKRAEDALQESETRYRLLIDTAQFPIVVVSAADLRVLFINEHASRMFGVPAPQAVGLHASRFWYRKEDLSRFIHVIKERGIVKDFETELRAKSGAEITVMLSSDLIEFAGQKANITVFQDITERKKIEDKLRETLSGLRNALGGIFQVLSATTEKRDPYTAGHQKRVADLARAIGQEMGLAEDRVEGLRIAATIHDIGKVSIPAEILSKPKRLTEIEFKLIQSHSQAGSDILRDIDFSWPLADIVLQHHERINGSGYPQGLKGENILLEARILAVSDVVEAMASHRPYRPSLGIEAALEEIEKNKGVIYDPDVASACLTLFREKGFAFK